VQGVGDLSQITWKAIASTPSVDAKDNIGLISSAIYNTGNELVATDGPDLFDWEPHGVDDLLAPIRYEEDGSLRTVGSIVWTGTDRYGSEKVGGGGSTALGAPTFTPPRSTFGTSSSIASSWISSNDTAQITPYPLYAISEELTVVPVPGAAILGMIGIGMVGAYTRKRRLPDATE